MAIIEGRYDDSVDHLRMIYQLGQNVSKLSFLVANLVGIAEVGIANQGMLDLIAAKDSPNMYWALAELPQPIVSIRDSLRLESSFPLRYVPELIEIENADYSDEKWNEVLTDLIASLNRAQRMTQQGQKLTDQGLKWAPLAFGMAGYASAKQRLIDSGMDAKEINEMPVAQVLLIDAARDCRLFSDDTEKSYYLPFDKVNELDRKVQSRLRSLSPSRLGAMIVYQFSPAITQVRQAELRAQAHINVLMAIESIRNHLATTGEMPASLDELELPVRNNPFTGKPINYELRGETAVLSLLKGEGSYDGVRYEISVAPEK